MLKLFKNNLCKGFSFTLEKELLRLLIPAKLTMHLSRHTFAGEAGDKIPIKLLQMLYRHSNPRTTIAYQSKFIHKDADEALESVIGK